MVPTVGFAFEIARAVDVGSGETVRATGPLVEPETLEVALGENTAVSCGGGFDAAKKVWQVTVTATPLALGGTETIPQPLIGLPAFSKVMAPAGLPAVGVTVAIMVTVWFVTAEVGAVVSVVVLEPEVWPSAAWPLMFAV